MSTIFAVSLDEATSFGIADGVVFLFKGLKTSKHNSASMIVSDRSGDLSPLDDGC